MENTNPDPWRPPLGQDLLNALKKNLGITPGPGILDNVKVI
jgi:hypothetical protein